MGKSPKYPQTHAILKREKEERSLFKMASAKYLSNYLSESRLESEYMNMP